jgi:hypothetical protein
MYDLKKKLERYLRVNLLGPGPSCYKKIIYRAAGSQRLRNTGLKHGDEDDDKEQIKNIGRRTRNREEARMKRKTKQRRMRMRNRRGLEEG